VDSMRVDFHRPFPTQSGEAWALEFYNPPLDRYFLTADPALVSPYFDGGAASGWELTGEAFKVTSSLPILPTGVPVCRFDSFPGAATPSQYLTADEFECSRLRATPGWSYAGVPFRVQPVLAGGSCADGQLKVMSAFNGKAAQGNANYRLSTSDSTMREMTRKGWEVEGTVMCVGP